MPVTKPPRDANLCDSTTLFCAIFNLFKESCNALFFFSNNEGLGKDYKNGKTKLLGFFVGQVMKDSKGLADPKTISQLLKDKLHK